MNPSESLIVLANLLAERLERLSADSAWSHRASGYRGNLLKTLEQAQPDPERLKFIVLESFKILEAAAREVAVPEELRVKD